MVSGSIIATKRELLAGLCGAWLCLAAFAPVAVTPRLGYALEGLSDDRLQPGETSNPYPPREAERPVSPIAEPARREQARKVGAEWRLAIDASLTADSNVTNGSDLVALPAGGGALPIPLDPAVRKRAGIGYGVSAAAALRLPIAPGAKLALDAEGYTVEYEGGRSDDAALLLAAGVELGEGADTAGSLQFVAFERWYAGVVANRGIGARGKYRLGVGDGENISLAIDARIFESGYGEEFGGTQAAFYLTYDRVLASDLSGSVGLLARREWLETDAYSGFEIGAYGGLSYYLSKDLIGGVSGGISRLTFDAPLLFLSPKDREDWRIYASVYLSTRRPVGWGLFPSLTYSFNKTDSSIGFYRAERHRVRLGLLKSF